jgi:hypothetical protein
MIQIQIHPLNRRPSKIMSSVIIEKSVFGLRIEGKVAIIAAINPIPIPEIKRK